MQYLKLHNLGTFDNMSSLWKTYQRGGKEGDYCVIGEWEHYWDKYQNEWISAESLSSVPSESLPRETTDIYEDINFHHDINVAGKIRGNFEFSSASKGLNKIAEYLELEEKLKSLIQTANKSVNDINDLNDKYNKLKEQLREAASSTEESFHAKYADEADNADKWDGYHFSDVLDQPLRKTDSPVFKKITTNEIGSPSFTPGMYGMGWKIDDNGQGELEGLILRRFLEVPELRYNRISIEVGNKWNGPGGGIIESITPDKDEYGNELMTGIARLHLEEGEYGTLQIDDICHGIFHDTKTSSNAVENTDDSLGNFQFAGFASTYFRVTDIIGPNGQIFKYQLRGMSDRWRFKKHPYEGMHFVAYGNFSNTDRQCSRYSTRTYERFLQNVNDWEFSAGNIAAQFGDLSNLDVFGLKMQGYSAYLNNIYMTGTIKQFEMLPPRLEIDTKGDTSLAFGESLRIKCKVYKGLFDEVTSQVTSWSITRDSGNSTEDMAWQLKNKVKDFNGEIDICFNNQENDLGGNEYTISTLFTIRAEIGEIAAKAQLVI